METDVLYIYGFGSFFKNVEFFNDIDFLIIHQNLSKLSCRYAINCKKILLQKIKNAHICMLSIQEENSIQFIKESKAVFLGRLHISNIENDLAILIDNINRNLRVLPFLKP